MFQQIVVRKMAVSAAAAMALSAAGVICGSGPASAFPACVQYGFPGDVNLIQTNGWSVQFSSTGSTVNAPATATHSGGGKLSGTITGGIEGKNINLLATWDNGSRGRYTGTVQDDAHMVGDSEDETDTASRAKYRSQFPISCLTTADPAPPANPGAPSKTAFVTTPPEYGEVDVYDAPGGTGNVIGTIAKDKGVQVNADCKPDDWCLIRGVAVPGGQGWMWGHLRFE